MAIQLEQDCLPCSLPCRGVPPGPDGRAHGGHCRPAAGHGVCHRQWCAAAGRDFYRGDCRLSGLGAGRHAAMRYRAYRGVYRHHLRHRAEVRRGQPDYLYLHGGGDAGDHGLAAAGAGHQVFPHAADYRLYQRHCRTDFPHPAERLFRPAHACPSTRCRPASLR